MKKALLAFVGIGIATFTYAAQDNFITVVCTASGLGTAYVSHGNQNQPYGTCAQGLNSIPSSYTLIDDGTLSSQSNISYLFEYGTPPAKQ